ncbi:MAG: LysE family translocator [Pseudomonadota bacterium]
MTLTLSQILLYSGALAILVMTPGPVVVAILARSASGGVSAAVPLSLGVVVGDILWPLVAIFGLSAIVLVYADFLTVLRYVGALVLISMGVQLLRGGGMAIRADGELVRASGWQGFMAGLLVILGNPKAILFYMGILPGFFLIAELTVADIVIICALSALVPWIGNMVWAAAADRARRFLRSERAITRVNRGSGIALILVGLAIAVSGDSEAAKTQNMASQP